jgi:hypothetical protein
MNTDINLNVPYLETSSSSVAMELLYVNLDNFPKHAIAYAPWAQGAEQPEVKFSIVHSEHAILLKYYVKERQTRATYFNINDPVYEDSCVEFFIAFKEELMYYNLEFNCLGTPRVEYGANRYDRKFINPELIKAIRSQLTLTKGVPGYTCWELLLQIPLSVFSFHPALALENTSARVNFYKCGDALPNPHFLCYNNIAAEQPNFHLPAFFKGACFNSKVDQIQTTTNQQDWFPFS